MTSKVFNLTFGKIKFKMNKRERERERVRRMYYTLGEL
jgi:hypothetical protein